MGFLLISVRVMGTEIYKVQIILGRGCGAVDSVVASDTRDLRFEPRHGQDYFFRTLFITVIIICSEKTKINGERGQEWPVFKFK